MVLVGRPGYRIDTVLSRGALDWALAYQLERAQTFAYLPSSSFLVLIWIVFLLGFGACCDLHDKPKFSENGFRMENLLHFRVGNIIGLSVRKVPHLPMCVNLTLFMVLNISTFCRPSPCRYLSNKIGFTSFDFRTWKLLDLQFSLWRLSEYPKFWQNRPHR